MLILAWAKHLQDKCHLRQANIYFQVLSLPANFTYNPPGSNRNFERQPSSRSQARRQTLHSQQPIMLSNLEGIKSIDESTTDLQEFTTPRKPRPKPIQENLDDIITINVPEPTKPEKKTNRDNDGSFLLVIPQEQKPLHRLYGSTRHLFAKQRSMEITEETPFLLETDLSVPETKLVVEKVEVNLRPEPAVGLVKNDSQESVQRIISERRKLDDSFKDIDQSDIYDITNKDEIAEVQNSEQSECKAGKSCKRFDHPR